MKYRKALYYISLWIVVISWYMICYGSEIQGYWLLAVSLVSYVNLIFTCIIFFRHSGCYFQLLFVNIICPQSSLNGLETATDLNDIDASSGNCILRYSVYLFFLAFSFFSNKKTYFSCKLHALNTTNLQCFPIISLIHWRGYYFCFANLRRSWKPLTSSASPLPLIHNLQQLTFVSLTKFRLFYCFFSKLS